MADKFGENERKTNDRDEKKLWLTLIIPSGKPLFPFGYCKSKVPKRAPAYHGWGGIYLQLHEKYCTLTFLEFFWPGICPLFNIWTTSGWLAFWLYWRTKNMTPELNSWNFQLLKGNFDQTSCWGDEKWVTFVDMGMKKRKKNNLINAKSLIGKDAVLPLLP